MFGPAEGILMLLFTVIPAILIIGVAVALIRFLWKRADK
jgi:hypothetical protein